MKRTPSDESDRRARAAPAGAPNYWSRPSPRQRRLESTIHPRGCRRPQPDFRSRRDEDKLTEDRNPECRSDRDDGHDKLRRPQSNPPASSALWVAGLKSVVTTQRYVGALPSKTWHGSQALSLAFTDGWPADPRARTPRAAGEYVSIRGYVPRVPSIEHFKRGFGAERRVCDDLAASTAPPAV
jgi:hypothetical protein